MARHRPRSKQSSKQSAANDSADKFGHGVVEEFFHTRDKVSLGPENASDEEDYLTGQTEEVFGLDLPKQRNDEDDYEEEEEEQAAPVKKSRKTKAKDVTLRGRFAKTSSDEESDGEGDTDSESDPDAEGWGRSYYSRPSTRREREDGQLTGEDAERREEERELELNEVKRLQKKLRQSMRGEDDWGLDELVTTVETQPREKEGEESTAVSATIFSHPPAPPATSDPQALINHLAANEPVKLALTRDFPLIVKRLEKTERGVKKMQDLAASGGIELNPGFAWLHYQSLVTYATTLAFYIHLAALPESSRPDFSSHPIIPRLLQLKEGINMLEDLDLAAASDDEGDTIELFDRDALEEEDEELAEGKQELFRKLQESGILGGGGVMDWQDDAEDVWEAESLEEDELEELKRDAQANGEDEDEDDEDDQDEIGSDEAEEDSSEHPDEDDEEGSELSLSDDGLDAIAALLKRQSPAAPKAKVPASKAQNDTLLEEPAFVPSKPSTKSSKRGSATHDDLGDPTHLNEADSADKAAKKRSLRFHTSKIAATSARRAAARQERMGGDDDIPYRDKKAARDAALRKNSGGQEDGADLDGSEWTDKDRKRAREVMEGEDGGDVAVEGDDGYYDLVKRRRTEEKQAKKDEYDAGVAARKAELDDIEAHSGPRSLTRAIEKNKGLTPHRSKSVRNPRVKKRERYEKAKRKVSSQRAVYKGGQGALGGAYQGEKSGISTVSKSRRF